MDEIIWKYGLNFVTVQQKLNYKVKYKDVVKIIRKKRRKIRKWDIEGITDRKECRKEWA